MKRLSLACAALLTLAACSAAPTEPVGFDAAPGYRSEGLIGSGTASDAFDNTTQSDTTGRGPNMMGSGT